VLKFLAAPERDTVERLHRLFSQNNVLFTLVGGAACREYGLSRPINDLDFVVNPYPVAASVLAASFDFAEFGEPDPTHRTCTMKDLKTGVLVDLVAGGIRITDGALFGNVHYCDPLPIPEPTGFGDLVSLHTLIEMKLGAIVSGLDTRALGANDGGRDEGQVQRDIQDIRDLITIHQLSRRLIFGGLRDIQRAYESIYDGVPVVSPWANKSSLPAPPEF
jgi:hypothetical protein